MPVIAALLIGMVSGRFCRRRAPARHAPFPADLMQLGSCFGRDIRTGVSWARKTPGAKDTWRQSRRVSPTKSSRALCGFEGLAAGARGRAGHRENTRQPAAAPGGPEPVADLGLMKWHPEQKLHHQTKLASCRQENSRPDGFVIFLRAEYRRSAIGSGLWRDPHHVPGRPDQREPAPLWLFQVFLRQRAGAGLIS